MPRDLPIRKPNLGLYLDRPALDIPLRGLQGGLNFRIKNGTITNLNLGWERFSDNWTLNGPVTFIDNFFPTDQDEKLLFGTTSDIYLYHPVEDTVTYLTPQYTTGTVAVSGTGVTGTGTVWLTNAAVGDEIVFGEAGFTGTSPSGNDSFTKVLLHMNGADASTTFRDDNAGGSAHTWTPAGNAQIDTAQSALGGASGLFDGVGDEITTPDSADYVLGTSDFTFNVRIRPAAATDGSALYVSGQTDAGLTAAGSSFYILRTAGNKIQLSVSDGAAFTSMNSTSNVTAGNWYDVEMTRTGGNLRMFVNGTLENTVAFSGTIPNVAEVLAVGSRRTAAGTPWNGHIDEYKLDVGIARDTVSFTTRTDQFLTSWFEIQAVGGDTSITLTSSAGTIAAGSPYTIRRLFTGDITNIWSFDTFVEDSVSGDDLWIATNGIDPVVSWNGTDTAMTREESLGFTCGCLAVWSNMMIYGNVQVAGDPFPSSIINSDVGAPLDVVSGLSSQFRVHDGTDPILNMVPLAEQLVLYGERHIVQTQFVGSPLVFVFREPASGLGPVSHNAIADFGDYHEFVGPDSGYTFDGVSVREVHIHVWRDIIRQTDPSRRLRIYGHFDEEQGDLIWSVPGTTDPSSGTETAPPTIAWVEHYLEDLGPQAEDQPYSKRQFPFTATGFYQQVSGLRWSDVVGTWADQTFSWGDQSIAANFPINLAGDNDGIIWIINTVQEANGVLLPFNVHFGRLPMDSGRERSLLTRVYPFAEQTNQTVDVRVWVSDHAAGPSIEVADETFDTALPESVYFVSVFRRGRYVEIEFHNTGNPVTLWGYDLDWVRKGGWR